MASRPRVVFVHGSATDHTTWSIQTGSSLKDRFDLVAPDRDFARTTVAEHASDLATAVGDRAVLVGSSFGAVICLELLRTRPELVPGAILIEPPLPASDDATLATAQAAFYEEFERRLAADGGPAAGEFFLQYVLGPEAYARIPQAFRERSKQRWAEIRADSVALIAYRPHYAELRSCDVPVALVGGARSAPLFAPTLDALAEVLPEAERITIPSAGHMLHAEAPRAFAALLTQFVEDVWPMRS
ncbi:MAG TPA: alpha/beta fold hydrolase [Kofleriaceae bacterium]